MGAITSRCDRATLIKAARRKFPYAVRFGIEVFQVDGAPAESEVRLLIVKSGMRAWSTVRVASSPSELMLQLTGAPIV
jgi:hypothetical protein